jgi:hypothetical protein
VNSDGDRWVEPGAWFSDGYDKVHGRVFNALRDNKLIVNNSKEYNPSFQVWVISQEGRDAL